jgi:hypothetical protein
MPPEREKCAQAMAHSTALTETHTRRSGSLMIGNA